MPSLIQSGRFGGGGGGAPGTFTLYPTIAAGHIRSYSEVGWTQAREGTGTLYVDSNTYLTAGTRGYQGDTYIGPYWEADESFLNFDFSTVTGTVTAATLSLGLRGDASDTDFTVEARSHDWGTGLAAADFVAGSGLGAKTLLATLGSSGIGALDVYKAMTESGTALKDAAVAVGTGVLRLLLCSDQHRLDTNPLNLRNMNFHQWDHATLKPKLVVTTT